MLEANKNGVVYSSLEWRKRLESFGEGTDAPILATGATGHVDDICEMGEETL